jgi:hypothetical protein
MVPEGPLGRRHHRTPQGEPRSPALPPTFHSSGPASPEPSWGSSSRGRRPLPDLQEASKRRHTSSTARASAGDQSTESAADRSVMKAPPSPTGSG